MAMGVLAAARDHGLHVPEDVSVVGFDDTYLAGMRYVDLTSVHASPHEIGVETARRLVLRIADPQRPAEVLLVVPSLTVRSSTAPPRRA
jgi:DNA-binding LacI/PurR family transcriptional regulator